MKVLVYKYEEDYGGDYIEFIAKDVESSLNHLLVKEKEIYDYSINQAETYIKNLLPTVTKSYWHDIKRQPIERYESAMNYVYGGEWNEDNIETFCLNKNYSFSFHEVV